MKLLTDVLGACLDAKKKEKFYLYWLNQRTGKPISHVQNQTEILRGKYGCSTHFNGDSPDQHGKKFVQNSGRWSDGRVNHNGVQKERRASVRSRGWWDWIIKH